MRKDDAETREEAERTVTKVLALATRVRTSVGSVDGRRGDGHSSYRVVSYPTIIVFTK